VPDSTLDQCFAELRQRIDAAGVDGLIDMLRDANSWTEDDPQKERNRRQIVKIIAQKLVLRVWEKDYCGGP